MQRTPDVVAVGGVLDAGHGHRDDAVSNVCQVQVQLGVSVLSPRTSRLREEQMIMLWLRGKRGKQGMRLSNGKRRWAEG